MGPEYFKAHGMGVFHEVFDTTRDEEMVLWIESCWTPKHGGWLKTAVKELCGLTRRCRISDLGTGCLFERPINVDDARCKL